ncbi:UNVERIFIED_CONTAM: Photosynthetic NDH subunit of lumenal location 1, chloroplastic [Sesamum latifolium]|uniref:Photosynthetic NDH subunit of lumenal location 1, chloroplastic n=1 Tax=Sesamum latifolium TaxID=2727402 RepID=A0AAW2XRM6_9LAMI
MAVSSLSLTFISEPLTKKLLVRSWTSSAECGAVSSHGVTKCSRSDSDKKVFKDLDRAFDPQDNKVVANLVTNVYSAPTQVATILDMQERTMDGRNYWTFEYILTSPNFARAAFATIAIGNGRYYTLIVGANERRWRKVRNKLKVVADSFKVLDI